MFRKERKAVAEIMRRLYAQNLTSCSGGNVSLKNKEGYIFITASQTDKSSISWKEVLVLDNTGQNLCPKLKPSMEYGMHKKIYEARKDVFAIVHSHPIYASIYAIAGISPSTALTGEARYLLGDISLADYFLMGSDELASELAGKIVNHDVCIMKNHGAICLGKTLFEAFDKMEVLEFTSKLNYKLNIFEQNNILSNKQIKEIDALKYKIQ